MYCISCGSRLPENARYCAQCGAKVPDLVEDNDTNGQAADVIDVEAIVKTEDGEVDRADALSGVDGAENGQEAEERSDGATPADRSESDKASRQASGPLDLPEIDPASPYVSQNSKEDPGYDPFPDQGVPFKPSYGPLKSADIDFSLEGDTAKMPRILSEDGEVLVEGDSPAKNFVQSNTVPKRWTPGKVALLVFMIAVAIALVGVIAWIQLGRSEEGSTVLPSVQSSQTTQASPGNDVAESDSEGSDASKPELTEEERLSAIFAQLQASYEEIGTLNDEVAKAVDDYNTYYVDPDLEDRTSASQRCSQVSESIAEGKSALESSLEEYGCEAGSEYYDQAQSLLELFGLLDARVSPLIESWSRSIASSSPSSDESYILEPIAQAGSSNALSQFNALYASSEPRQVD